MIFGFSKDLVKLASRCRVDDNGCWIWGGPLDKDGYADPRFHGSHRKLHRVMYEAFVEPIPHRLTIDHLCRKRSCCNPDHLETVTLAENVRRGDHRTNHWCKRKTHCKNGHQLSNDNVRYTKNNVRLCKKCKQNIDSRFYKNKKAICRALNQVDSATA